MNKEIYVRVVGMYYVETDVELFVGDTVELRAEPKNAYDAEAIKVLKDGEKIGYVANSTNTNPAGCHSAGRLLEVIKDDYIPRAEVIVMDENFVLCRYKQKNEVV